VIHVVTIANQHLYAKQLDQMFRMRHEFYVRQRGWTDLTSEDERETDEFDNEHAVYLMNLDAHGDILATFRLNPTDTPYLMGDKLTHYISGEPPHDPKIWDLTRWMVVPHARRKGEGQIADAQKVLLCGVMEFAVDRGITSYTCLMDTVFVDRMKNVWPVKFIGDPHHFEDGDGDAVAVQIEAGPHVLFKTRDLTKIYDTVLFELKPDAPESEEEAGLRETAIRKETPMKEVQLDRVREAASMLVNELKNFSSQDDLENSISAVQEFTRFISKETGKRELEDA